MVLSSGSVVRRWHISFLKFTEITQSFPFSGRCLLFGTPHPPPPLYWNHRLSGKSMSNLWDSITYGQNPEPQRVTLSRLRTGRATRRSYHRTFGLWMTRSDVTGWLWILRPTLRKSRWVGQSSGRAVVHRTSSWSLPVCDAGTRRFAPRGGRMRPPLHFAADAATGVFGRSRIWFA